MKIHHIGYMVKHIDKAIDSFSRLGYELISDTVDDDIREAQICFLSNGGYVVELVSPHKESDLYELLKKYKNTAYHICYKVESLEKSVTELEKNGFHLFKEIEQAPAISATAKVCFLMDAGLGMIELVEDI